MNANDTKLPAKIRLLVVDDSATARQAILDYLHKLPYVSVVAEAESGHAALKHLRETPVDLALIDVHMPGLNGNDTTALVRRRHPRVRVILMSAQDSVGDRMTSLEAGADYFLPKPEIPTLFPSCLVSLFPHLADHLDDTQ